MAILAGPAMPMEHALTQLTRSQRDEPFGPFEGMGQGVAGLGTNPVENAIMQICKLMNRLMGIVEDYLHPTPVDRPDDFMKGWGEPGGDIEEP